MVQELKPRDLNMQREFVAMLLEMSDTQAQFLLNFIKSDELDSIQVDT